MARILSFVYYISRRGDRSAEKEASIMKKLIIILALLMSGCVMYPAGYNPNAYQNAGPVASGAPVVQVVVPPIPLFWPFWWPGWGPGPGGPRGR
jgi:hypothetical protein